MTAKRFRIMGKSSDGIAAALSRDTRSGRPILGWMYENGRGVQRGPRGSCPLVSTCGGSGRFVGAGAARPVFGEQSNGVIVCDDASCEGVGAAQYGDQIARSWVG